MRVVVVTTEGPLSAVGELPTTKARLESMAAGGPVDGCDEEAKLLAWTWQFGDGPFEPKRAKELRMGNCRTSRDEDKTLAEWILQTWIAVELARR